MKDGGNRKGVLRVEPTTLERIGFAQKREGSATKTSITRGTTCID